MSTLALRREDLWEVNSRVIVYSAIGAALYAVGSQFSFLLPGTGSVSLRPAFALVTFFGFAFGPIVGLFTGLVGNAIGDQISGWGLLTSWNWSVAVGLVGLLTGIFASYLGERLGSNKLVAAAIVSALATIIGLLFVFTDIIIGTAEDFNAALVQNYGPAVISDVIVVVILTPI
ncbi:MAG TPA: ECF transporter S component, partial [Candidatus Limnocylindrales bacterium]|nr:ECF transporter S component [Candidatus Limnocylindrales bacterium]